MASQSTPELLSDQINKATRTLHSQLNRLITSRLHLCLPPYNLDPDVYAIGFAHFAQIYLSFEAVWDHVIATHASDDRLSGPNHEISYRQPTDDQPLSSTGQWQSIKALLASIRPAGIVRSERIKDDLSTLLRIPSEELTSHLQVLSSSSPALVAFSNHIRTGLIQKPHALLAYAWVMYMAVFSGGRYIRAQLLKGGQHFWSPADTVIADRNESQIDTHSLPLTFWYHPGHHDGEDIKSEFKARLASAGTLLSVEQRDDILTEAGYIFDLCLALVQELELSVPLTSNVPERQDLKTTDEKTVAQELGNSMVTPLSLSEQKVRNIRWSRSFWTTTAITLGTGVFTWLARDQRVLEVLKS